jgi:hypothetical protein
MSVEREAPESVIQGRLLKIIGATPKLTRAGAKWLQEHAVPADLRKQADAIDAAAAKHE